MLDFKRMLHDRPADRLRLVVQKRGIQKLFISHIRRLTRETDEGRRARRGGSTCFGSVMVLIDITSLIGYSQVAGLCSPNGSVSHIQAFSKSLTGLGCCLLARDFYPRMSCFISFQEATTVVVYGFDNLSCDDGFFHLSCNQVFGLMIHHDCAKVSVAFMVVGGAAAAAEDIVRSDGISHD
jgi:hypothetical protein